MDVSIIIPCYNSVDTLARCVASVARQTSRPHEIFVIDDASTDGTADIIRRLAEEYSTVIPLYRERQGGCGAARNLALQQARGRYVVFIDADEWAPDGWLEQLIAPLDADTADCTGGPDRVPDGDPLLARCIGWSMDSGVASGGLRLGGTRLVTYLPQAGNMALKRELFDRVGDFNEAYHNSGEDKELLYRVRNAGGRIRYVPEALVWHHRFPSLKSYSRKMFWYGLRRVDIWREIPNTFEWPHLMPAILVAILFVLLCTPSLYGWLWLAFLALLLDALAAAVALRDVRALVVVPLTSAAIPLGYGLGILVRGVELLLLLNR